MRPVTNAKKFHSIKNALGCVVKIWFAVAWEPVVLIGSAVFPVILCLLVAKENMMGIMLRQIPMQA